MNYIGSKFRLSLWIFDEISKAVDGGLKDKVFCDMFAGTGIIGKTFKLRVKKVMSNDLEYYSYVLNKNYIQNRKKIPRKKKLIRKLNNLPLRSDGIVFKNYCKGSGSGRQYFKDKNGKRIDAIRLKIEKWRKNKKIDKKTYYFLLASLLESSDKVANTASVYGSFLKHLKPTAQKNFVLKSANFKLHKRKHKVFNKNGNELIKKISGDILYLDPPYNHRQYGINYHLLNTIALYDNFIPKGKCGRRDYQKSDYCSRRKVMGAFEDLIKNAKFKYIFLSYNNEGLMDENSIKNIMQKYGNYHFLSKKHKKFKANDVKKANTKTIEYLHVLEKSI